MIRKNPFANIYKECNTGSNKEKFLQCKNNKNLCPKYIDIELTNHCNINCYMCPVGTHAMLRKKGFMSMEIVELICNELKKGNIQGVRLVRWGEPVLHPQFIEILKMLKATGKMIHFNTNGLLLNRESIEQIIQMKIDSIKFSFQGVDKESYEEMRNGSSWDLLLKNIILMNEIRGEREKPYIQISTTVTNENQQQIQIFQNKISKLCDYYNIGKTELSHLNVDKMNISDEKKEKYLELKKRENYQKKHLDVCPEVYDKLSINWDGTISACCSDYDNMLVIGDIKKECLQEIFNNNKIDRIRKLICNGNYDNLPVCNKCFEYIKLEKTNT